MTTNTTLMPTNTTLPGTTSSYISEGTGPAPGSCGGDEVMTATTYLFFSKIMFYPCSVILLLTASILLYLILAHFRHLIHLYFSLIFYTSTQLFLCVVLFTSVSLKNAKVDGLSGWCETLSTVEVFATILPGYGVLLITLARWTCVAYPTNYKTIMDLRLQLVVVSVLLGALGLLSCLPLLGVCSWEWTAGNRGFCGVSSSGGRPCQLFLGLVVGVGYILPSLGVILLYCLIVRALVLHKKREKRLGKVGGKKKTDYNYTPVTVTDKMKHLKAIGQDAIPWSIVVVLGLNSVATLPWIPQLLVPEEYYSFCNATMKTIVLDIVYCVMLCAIGVSPAAYVLTTPNMRAKIAKVLRKRPSSPRISQTSKGTTEETKMSSVV